MSSYKGIFQEKNKKISVSGITWNQLYILRCKIAVKSSLLWKVNWWTVFRV